MLFHHFYKLAISVKQGKRKITKCLWKFYILFSYLYIFFRIFFLETRAKIFVIGKCSGQERPHPQAASLFFQKQGQNKLWPPKNIYMAKIKGFPSKTLHPISHQNCVLFNSSFSNLSTKTHFPLLNT